MNWLKSRDKQIMVFLAFLMFFLIIRLFVLSVIQEQKWSEQAESLSIKKIHIPATRGNIYDRYGRLIAGNRPSFVAEFFAQDLDAKEINRQIIELCKVLEENGDVLNDTFPIIIDSKGKFYYSHDKNIREWLESQALPTSFDAKQAFNEICRRNGISSKTDPYDAQKILQEEYNIFPPISVVKMKYIEELNKNGFLERYGLDEKTNAQKAFHALRKKFGISDSLSDEEARKIMTIRNEVAAQAYTGYIPVVVSNDLSKESIVTLAERSYDLSAINVEAKSIRYYPNEKTAAHIIGYIGKIAESEKEYYKEKGYNITDTVGKEGVEKAYEPVLRGYDGVRTVEVNNKGEMTRIISETPAVAGKDIYLNIDLELQKCAEDTLEDVLRKIRAGGSYTSKYGTYTFGEAYRNANVGAAVAIDVKTGEILALASYPAYDPNVFTKEMSKDQWRALQAENPRDPLSPVPLLNVATKTAVQPGSTFKMITAIAALSSGLDPNRMLRDGGAVEIGDKTFGCVIWNKHRQTHGYLNLKRAIEVSCNYYFFDLVAGKDLTNDSSLNLDPEMSIERITHYAKQFGLGEKTGIEIPEIVVPVPSEERKMEGLKTSLRNILIGRSDMYFKSEIVKDKKKLIKRIETIVSWMEENPDRKTIYERLKKLGVKEDMIYSLGDLCKYTYFKQADWNIGDGFNIAIGQGENAYTTLQMANFVATIGNGGVHNEAKLLRAIEGKGVIERPYGKKADVKNKHLDEVIEGMRRVAHGSEGSAKGLYNNFPVKAAVKTGTAERAGRINTPDEVKYLKTHLHQINNNLKWSDIEKEMKRIQKEYPEIYTTRDSAARQAVVNLSRGKTTPEKIDKFKPKYDNFAWFVSIAPVDDPKIAVAVLLFQGGSGGNAGPVAREITGKYLELSTDYKKYDLSDGLVP